MLPSLLDRLTPRAHPRTRLMTAAIVWSVVGTFLSVKGLWLSRQQSPIVTLAAVGVGLGLGFVKSRFIFDKVARKIVAHIEKKPRPACLGGLFSVKNWVLIVVMSVFGKAIGALPIDAALKTGIYVMVGSGLGFSSRLMWEAWKKPLPSPF